MCLCSTALPQNIFEAGLLASIPQAHNIADVHQSCLAYTGILLTVTLRSMAQWFLTALMLSAEQKLLHRMATTDLQEPWLTKTAELTSFRQKLFGKILQGFASTGQHLQKAVPQALQPYS